MLTGNESIILEDVLQSITQGKYREHERLPSENQLANYYNVPRINVRKALLKLEDMGFIYSQQGKGRFLKPVRERLELNLIGRASFREQMEDVGCDLAIQNLDYIKTSYDPKVYAHLQVERDEEVFMISHLYSIADQAVALHITYIAKSNFPYVERDGNNIVSMSAYYEQHGFTDFLNAKRHLSISFPTSLERSLFNCSRLIPLLVVEGNCMEMAQNKVIAYTKMIYRSDYFSYVVEDQEIAQKAEV